MRLLRFLIILIIVISLCLLLVGCGFLFVAITKTDFDLLHEATEINSIEIVIIGEVKRIEDTSSDYTVAYEPSFDVICKIQEIEQFIEEFSEVDCFMRISDPSRPLEGDNGIKIVYNNGDYDIICAYGQGEYKNGTYDFERGYHSFDEVEFNTLINKYLNVSTDSTYK